MLFRNLAALLIFLSSPFLSITSNAKTIKRGYGDHKKIFTNQTDHSISILMETTSTDMKKQPGSWVVGPMAYTDVSPGDTVHLHYGKEANPRVHESPYDFRYVYYLEIKRQVMFESNSGAFKSMNENDEFIVTHELGRYHIYAIRTEEDRKAPRFNKSFRIQHVDSGRF